MKNWSLDESIIQSKIDCYFHMHGRHFLTIRNVNGISTQIPEKVSNSTKETIRKLEPKIRSVEIFLFKLNIYYWKLITYVSYDRTFRFELQKFYSYFYRLRLLWSTELELIIDIWLPFMLSNPSRNFQFFLNQYKECPRLCWKI